MPGPIPQSAIQQEEQAKARGITKQARGTENKLSKDLPAKRVDSSTVSEAAPETRVSEQPRALTESYDPRLLTRVELENEIFLIRGWLLAQGESSSEKQRLTNLLLHLEQQLSARDLAVEQTKAQLLAAREKPKTVDVAIQQLRLARAWATAERPIYDDALLITQNVLEFLLALNATANFEKHFRNNRNIISAEILTTSAVGYVRERLTSIRLYLGDERFKRRPMNRPLWDRAIEAVQAGREYFLILNDELRLDQSILAQNVDRAALFGYGTALVLFSLPFAIGLAVKAAPILLGAARIAAIVYRGALVRALTFYVTHPVKAILLSEFTVETTLDVVATGGPLEYLYSMRDPANLVPRVLNLFIIGIHLAPMGAKGRPPAQAPTRKTTIEVEVEVVEVTDQGAKVRVRKPPREIPEGEPDLPVIADDEPPVIQRSADVLDSTRDVSTRKIKNLQPSLKGSQERPPLVTEKTRARNQRESLKRLDKEGFERTAHAPVRKNVGRSNRAVEDRLTRERQLEGVEKDYFGRSRGDESARRKHAQDTLEQIRSKKELTGEEHDLKFLLTDRIDPKTGKTVTDWHKVPVEDTDGSITYKRAPGSETGPTIQIGHPVTRARGGADIFVLEDAEFNQATNKFVETPGGAAAKPFVYIDDVAVDLVTAMQWERLGYLRPGRVAQAPLVVPDLPTF